MADHSTTSFYVYPQLCSDEQRVVHALEGFADRLLDLADETFAENGGADDLHTEVSDDGTVVIHAVHAVWGSEVWNDDLARVTDAVTDAHVPHLIVDEGCPGKWDPTWEEVAADGRTRSGFGDPWQDGHLSLTDVADALFAQVEDPWAVLRPLADKVPQTATTVRVPADADIPDDLAHIFAHRTDDEQAAA